MARTEHSWNIGNLIAPPRFLLFIAVSAAAAWFAIPALGTRFGTMAAFDAGAGVFLLSCLPMFRHESEQMRLSACRNGANRAVLLLLTGAVTLVVLTSVASVLMEKNAAQPWAIPVIIGTLALSWTFSNAVYALHYAHLFYTESKEGGDASGFNFPETPEPDYWDFVYFAFCLGMTFQTSDVEITQGRTRRPVTLHCLAAFVFNLGVVAFTINVLGG